MISEQLPLLSIANLHLEFTNSLRATRQVVLNGVSLDIKPGEIYGLVGESGSGKSITAFSVMRLLPGSNAKITSGDIKFAERNLLAIPESEMRDIRGQAISMIFQEPMTCLNPIMPIGKQLGEVFSAHRSKSRFSAKEVLDKSIELLEQVGLPNPQERLGWYPHQLSGGQRQRVMIAMALAGDPQLLIADEPTTALDVTIQAQILALLKKIREERQLAILLITHDLGVVAETADRVGVMHHGKIIEERPVIDFFRSPQEEYSKLLLDSVPRRIFRSALPNSTAKPLLHVERMRVYFPVRTGAFRRKTGEVKAVDDVSFSIKPGQTLALVGESGSGKTTVGRAVLRLLEATDGQIVFEGQDISTLKREELRRKRSDMQIIFQDPFSSLNPRMRIGQILSEGMEALQIGGRTSKEREARIDLLLDQVGLLPEHKQRFPHEFSGGQRQRIAIARALSVGPKLVICDEPTSALDVSVRAQVIALLKDLQEKLKVSYLFITHDLSLVPSVAHEIAVMHQGKLVEYGIVEQVLTNPQHEYTKKLLSAVPQIPTFGANIK